MHRALAIVSRVRRRLCGYFAAACSFGCAAGSDTPGGPTTPVPPPPVSYQATGSAYVRTDSVAYPAGFIPGTGLSGGTVSFANTTVQSGLTGAFTARSTFSLGGEFVPVRVTAPGFADSWVPWTPPDSTAVISAGLYPDRTVTTRPGFLKGLYFMDGGGYMASWFSAGATTSTVARIKNDVSGNAVVYPDLWGVTAFDSVANTVTSSPQVGAGVPDFAVLFPQITSDARSRGLSPILLCLVFNQGSGAQIIGVSSSKTAFWDVYFAQQQAWLVDRAARARDLGIEYIVLQLPGAVFGFGSARIAPLVTAMRATGYRGKIVASFGVRPSRSPAGFYGYRFVDAAFWNSFDGLELGFSNIIRRSSAAEVLPLAHTRARMREDIRAVLDEVSTYPVPIFVRLEVPSVHGGLATTEYIEPCIRGCVSVASQRVRDYQQQADVYQAAAEVINALPSGGNGRVMGLFSWGYVWTNSLEEFEQRGWRAFDKSANVRGKPAEAVLKWWFQRW